MRYSFLSILSMVILTVMSVLCVPVHAIDQEASYLKHFPEDQRESAQLVAQKNRKLLQTWLNMYSAKTELNKQKLIFGSNKRKLANRQIPKLESYLERSEKVFKTDYKEARDAYEDKRGELKEDQFKLEARISKRPDSNSSKNLQKKVDAMGEEIRDYEKILAVFDTMKKTLDSTGEEMNVAKLYRVDEKTYVKYGGKFPDVVEAAHGVKDYHADIAEVKALMVENPGLERVLPNLEKGLQRAQGDLEKMVEREKDKLQRPHDSLKKAEEKLSKRIAAKESRGGTVAKEVKERAEIVKQIDDIESANTFFDSLIAGTEPAKEKEKENKKSPKKKKNTEKIEETSE